MTRSYLSVRTILVDATFLYSAHTQEARFLRVLSLLRIPSTYLETKTNFKYPRVDFLLLWSPESTSFSLVTVTPVTEVQLHPPTPGLCFHKSTMFLYPFLVSAAKAVLNFMSAVIAIAHVLSVSIKSLSVSTILPEYSFGKSK